jgi:hypothetical protein
MLHFIAIFYHLNKILKNVYILYIALTNMYFGFASK